MFVLDTNVLSELRRPERADPKVLAWAASQPLNRQYISAITILELELGVLLKEQKDARQGAVLRAWLDSRVLPHFVDRVLVFDQAIALRCANLHIPNPRPERDAIIAATALVHGMTLVTRNELHFRNINLPLLNPWK